MGQSGLCRTPSEELECCFFGYCFPCHSAYDGSKSFLFSVGFAHWLTSLVLFIVAGYNVYLFFLEMKQFNPLLFETKTEDKNKMSAVSDNAITDDQKDKEIADSSHKKKQEFIPWMRANSAFYAFVTALFGILRAVYGISEFLLIGAALHNLSEWGFVSFIFYPPAAANNDNTNNERRRHTFLAALFFIWFVIVVLICFTGLYSEALEQVTGISLDILLPICYIMLWFKAGNKEESTMWGYVVVATVAHLFGTILPLVAEGIFKGQSEITSKILEFLISFTVPVTHILYTRWVEVYQKMCKDNDNNSNFGERIVVSTPECLKEHRFGLFCFWWIIAFILGLIPIIFFPLMLKPCDNIIAFNTSSTGLCNDDKVYSNAVGYIYDGMSDAFEHLVFKEYNLINKAKQFKGNNFYHVLKSTNSTGADTKFLWFESWDSFEDAENWNNSDIVLNVFSDLKVISMLNGGELMDNSGYHKIEPCQTYNYHIGAIKFKLDNNCNVFWNDMIDMNGCKWIKDCIDVTNIINETNTGYIKRNIVLSNSQTYQQIITLISNNGKLFNYNINKFEYDSSIHLTPDISNITKCDIKIKFNVSETYQMTLQEIYNDYYDNIIPYWNSIYEACSK